MPNRASEHVRLQECPSLSRFIVFVHAQLHGVIEDNPTPLLLRSEFSMVCQNKNSDDARPASGFTRMLVVVQYRLLRFAVVRVLQCTGCFAADVDLRKQKSKCMQVIGQCRSFIIASM